MSKIYFTDRVLEHCKLMAMSSKESMDIADPILAFQLFENRGIPTIGVIPPHINVDQNEIVEFMGLKICILNKLEFEGISDSYFLDAMNFHVFLRKFPFDEPVHEIEI